eukprot:TRINITY_DN14543_c0_g1_i4.p2 TRINITY_DN14543_c0_g1~~TRINITY_DN14543_c0_g1_i4.p2  ORF type:complete len:212 (+),score=7.55 TRINITY_DN14543_c0_g1_i4:46-681(+)
MLMTLLAMTATHCACIGQVSWNYGRRGGFERIFAVTPSRDRVLGGQHREVDVLVRSLSRDEAMLYFFAWNTRSDSRNVLQFIHCLEDVKPELLHYPNDVDVDFHEFRALWPFCGFGAVYHWLSRLHPERSHTAVFLFWGLSRCRSCLRRSAREMPWGNPELTVGPFVSDHFSFVVLRLPNEISDDSGMYCLGRSVVHHVSHHKWAQIEDCG